MANAFNKEEIVSFENVLEGFHDQMVMSNLVNIYRPADKTMERTGDVIWRPMPYIMPSYDGMDQSANFSGKTQLAVPTTLGYEKSVPYEMNAKELRDALQEGRLGEGAKQKLASDINVAVTTVASQQGTLFVKRSAAASGFDDVALAEAMMNEIGVPDYNRNIALSTRDYNSMAGNLAGRQTLTPKALTAYERASIGQVASFDAYKLDYAVRLTAAAGVSVTVNGANQRYVPAATSTASTGQRNNVDNRYQNLAITVTSGTVKVGDALTIAGVNSVHLITKQDTGQLKTFRITAIVSGAGGTGTVQISPPIIAADSSPTQAEVQYKNVTATPASGAAITFLNTVAAAQNPFWQKDAIELVAGRYQIPSGAGVEVMYGTTDQGLTVSMTKWVTGETYTTRYRFDTFFGVTLLNPEHAGVMMFGQT